MHQQRRYVELCAVCEQICGQYSMRFRRKFNFKASPVSSGWKPFSFFSSRSISRSASVCLSLALFDRHCFPQRILCGHELIWIADRFRKQQSPTRIMPNYSGNPISVSQIKFPSCWAFFSLFNLAHQIFGISIHFLSNANELKLELTWWKKKESKNAIESWFYRSITIFFCRAVHVVKEKERRKIEKRQFPNRRQKFNRGIFLEYVWRMEYQSKVERKIKTTLNAYDFPMLLLQWTVFSFGRRNRICRASTYFHETQCNTYKIWLCSFKLVCAFFFVSSSAVDVAISFALHLWESNGSFRLHRAINNKIVFHDIL